MFISGGIMTDIYITIEGVKEKEARLRYLKNEKRPEVLERLKTAREYGDLSENSEYDAARNEQGQVETEIQLIEDTLRLAKVIDPSKVSKDFAGVGTSVKLYDEEWDEEVVYKIVGTIESDPDRGYISNESPIGKSLIGKKVGDVVTISTPGGDSVLKILSIY